jgi:hypothetical protein
MAAGDIERRGEGSGPTKRPGTCRAENETPKCVSAHRYSTPSVFSLATSSAPMPSQVFSTSALC